VGWEREREEREREEGKRVREGGRERRSPTRSILSPLHSLPHLDLVDVVDGLVELDGLLGGGLLLQGHLDLVALPGEREETGRERRGEGVRERGGASRC